ncbi:MAG: hypothetical protein L6R40_000532 [Gallowayella cf. fulva]|nr:MAG: hypothetical protein L6R40_000532 [Xanthomendoza cf. fulva]
MENSYNDPVLQVMEDPYDLDPPHTHPHTSAEADPDLPSFDYSLYGGTNDQEDSSQDSIPGSSPTARFAAYHNSNSHKRERGSLDLPSAAAGTSAKSRKTTPSPDLTQNTTPASFEAFDFSDDARLMDFFAGNPKVHIADMLKEQREQEERLRRKQQQEREDEAFARQLEEECGYQQPVLSTQPIPTTPQLPGLASQPFPNEHFQQEQYPIFTAPKRKVEEDQPSPSPHRDHKARYQQMFKSLPSSPPPPSVFDGFIDLGSDDDDGSSRPGQEPFTNDSRAAYKGGPRLDSVGPRWPGNTATRTGNGTELVSAGSQHAFDGGGTLGFRGTGGTNVYSGPSGIASSSPSNPLAWQSRMSGLGQSVTNMAREAWTSAHNLLGTHEPEYPNGFGSYSQPITLSSSPTHPGFAYNNQRPPGFSSEEWLKEQLRNSEDWLAVRTNRREEEEERRSRILEHLDRYNERVDYLTNDPTRTAAEIQNLLDNIRPDEELPPENREGTPEAMVYPLMEHQKLGLAWMKTMEEGSNKGGILADGMGLGKTIQAIALMVSRRSRDPNCKTTLIIAPVALMKQWEREIGCKLKGNREHQLKTYVLHGSGRQASWDQLKKYDVVLTTFGTLSTELKRRDTIDQAKRTNPNWTPITRSDHLSLLGDRCKWYRIIIDEAQCIKNRSTRASQAACELQAQTRFAMSGTPMQNNVTELYSLIRFLRIRPYNDFTRFSRDFSKPLKSSYQGDRSRAMQKLQALLKAILLRRDKKSTIDGKPILNLPERTTESQHAVLSEAEQEFYQAVQSQTQLQFNKYLRAGTVGRNYSNVLVLLLRLRQACCHPHLIKDFGIPSSAAETVSEDLEKMAKELAADVVARIIEQGAGNDQSGLECPVCMDATENATIFVPCGHNTCSECFARISDPSQAIANGDDGGTNLKCPQCRGKIVPSRVTDYVTFKKIHMEMSAAEEVVAELEGPSDDESESDDETADSAGSDLGGFIVDDENDEDATDEEEDGYRKGNTPFERCRKVEKPKKEKSAKGKGKAVAKAPKKSLAQLKKESLRNVKAKKKYLARVRKTWESSAKIDRTMDILRATNGRKEGEKTIIFSQFTSLLDLLEVPISDQGWKYQRYDGSMSSNARNDAVLEFSDKPDCTLMLVSLRAGNAGLNLVAASQVIIMDPFWNPYVEEQAIDRAHRIGQQRPVQVHRILVPGTVEDRILTLQEEKRAVIESALDENASKQVSRLGTRELAYLFGV